jgi:DNA polymerase/3'-5' exonuclease PolX
MELAERLVTYFRPAAAQIEVVGSVRRWKPDVHDIELLMAPDHTPLPRPRAEFGMPIPKYHKYMIDQLVALMVARGEALLQANGDRYKKLWMLECEVQLDLFLCFSPSEYGVSKVIRTGPKDFSQCCVTNRSKGGFLPDGYFVKHQVVWIEKEIGRFDVPEEQEDAAKLLTHENHLSMPKEMDFLNFLGLGWVEPKERVARWRHG